MRRFLSLVVALTVPTVAAAQTDQKAEGKACFNTAFEQHLAAAQARLVKPTETVAGLVSIEQLLERRREQERYCLQVADCVVMAAKETEDDMRSVRNLSFSNCLKTEMIDQYDMDVKRR